jgi:hypothetical protein
LLDTLLDGYLRNRFGIRQHATALRPPPLTASEIDRYIDPDNIILAPLRTRGAAPLHQRMGVDRSLLLLHTLTEGRAPLQPQQQQRRGVPVFADVRGLLDADLRDRYAMVDRAWRTRAVSRPRPPRVAAAVCAPERTVELWQESILPVYRRGSRASIEEWFETTTARNTV